MENKVMEENYQQMSLWDLIYPRKIIDKPIRLIEFFAGIGAQHKALKQLKSEATQEHGQHPLQEFYRHF